MNTMRHFLASPSHRLAATLSCFVVLLGSASAALARDEAGRRMPHAISPAELDRYADTLMLSTEQQHAIEIKHDRYLDAFAPLRGMMIEEVRRIYVSSGPFDNDGVLAEKLPGWISQVRALDDDFFSDVADVLTDAQREFLPRLRLQRERDIYYRLDAFVSMLGENVPDLSALIDGLDLTSEDRGRIDHLLRRYEEQLTRGLRRVLEALLRDCRNPPDRTRMGAVRVGPDGTPIREEPDPGPSSQALIDRVREMRDLNRRTYRELVRALPERLEDNFQRAFQSRAYGVAYEAVQLRVMSRAERALELPNLSDGERATIRRMRDDLHRWQRDTFEGVSAILDEEIIRAAGPGGARGGGPLMDALNAARQEARQLEREKRGEFDELLGERAGQIGRVTVEPRRTQARLQLICNVVVYTQRPMSVRPAGESWSWTDMDPLLPSPIDRESFDAIIALLHGSEAEKATLRELHKAYREEVEEKSRPLRNELARYSPGVRDASGRRIAPEERRAGQDSVREQYRRMLTALDRELFRAIADALDLSNDAPGLRHARALRERQMIEVRSPWSRDPEANLAGRVDLIALAALEEIEALVFPPNGNAEGVDAHRLQATFDEYTTELKAALNRQRKAFIRQEQSSGLSGVEAGGGRVDAQRRVREAHHAVARLNQTFVERIAKSLPAEEGDRLLTAFERRAYPPAFDDPDDMSRVITAALALGDLGASQRERLRDIRAAYQDAYGENRNRIIALCASFVPDLPGQMRTIESERRQAVDTWLLQMEGLADERAQINRRARREIRGVLSSAQADRVDLPKLALR